MPLASSVPKIQFTPAGLVIPTESAILAGVQSDIDAAFGGGVNPALETPQGQIASSQSAVIADKNAEIALVVNQLDPLYASGRFQDALGRIYFLTRKPALATVVQCQLVGVVGAVIPAGALAQDTSGNTYILSGSVTIGAGGTATGEFQNIETGPIACPAGTLVKVYQSVSGWDSVTNPTDGVIGSVVESRADFEIRRKNSVALNAHGTPASIYAAVFNIPDVVDVYVIDNPSNDILEVGNTSYPLAPHSIYVAAVGGLDADIARAIWTKKDLGCDYNGNTTEIIVDNSGYNYPPPSYEVKFQRPDPLPVKFAVRVVNDAHLPSDAVELIKAAIISRFNGLDGTQRERIGSLILSSRYYGAVASVSPNVSVLDILIGEITPTVTQVAVGIDERPTISADDITVTLVTL